jgi:hypothetical protein
MMLPPISAEKMDTQAPVRLAYSITVNILIILSVGDI